MAARATRSASRSSSAAESDALASLEARELENTLSKALDDVRGKRFPAHLLPLLRSFHSDLVAAEYRSKCHVLALSHDELGVIIDGLADPLEPVVAVAFSSTCKGLRTPLQLALEVLEGRHERAKALCRKIVIDNTQELREAEVLDWSDYDLTSIDLATLGMLLPKWLPKLADLNLSNNGIGDAGVQALCEGLGHGAAPSLRLLCLSEDMERESITLGPAGAEALAAALRRGAMPMLEALYLNHNPIGKDGAAALAAPLRTLPNLDSLILDECGICDEGVASLFKDLGKDEFKNLGRLWLDTNKITDKGCATITAAICQGALPSLNDLTIVGNHDMNPEARKTLREVRLAQSKVNSDSI